MSLLGNTSVRTILATVFVVLALALCGSLGWQLYSAWDLSRSAERASALANADKLVFAATYTVRQQRTDLQTAFQGPGDFVKAVQDTQKKAQDAYEAGLAAVEAAPGIDSKGLLGNVRDRWNTLVGRSRELEELARGLKERDVRVLDPWYKAMSDLLDEFAKVSLYLSNAVRMTDPAIAEYVQTRQLAWATRDTAGRECGTARPHAGTAKPFTPQARALITDMRGRSFRMSSAAPAWRPNYPNGSQKSATSSPREKPTATRSMPSSTAATNPWSPRQRGPRCAPGRLNVSTRSQRYP